MPAIPEGFSTLTPTLAIDGADKAIELYKKAFDAKEEYRMEDKGKIMHACLVIGDSKIFISDVFPGMGCSEPSRSSFYVYLKDVDSAFKQAKQAGLKSLYPLEDMFWGDRTGSVTDPFGNSWTLATHVREVSPEEMEEGRKEFEKKMHDQQAA